MKKEDLIRNLKAELSKLQETKKTYDTFETRYDLMIKDVLNYIENSIPKKKIEDKIFELHEAIVLENNSMYGHGDEEYINKLEFKINALQELLEDK